ncbi:UDP-N-acetylmuramoyl-L-alanyl-D-glutamate--2,6-diaminopimelate ligase [Virgibacillus oceani]|uniref:UDP-N-acetylmuramoyl-L-alanyl-D-glutamate--2,6-diaminopimelate ligase n=1 Tax=Virgibacillus oceani TaxID=1479511 RepID=A0A917H759_9BACI|nr:UDP-N-acetylmuramoyl-L-alanyl-D-glutamate--2,6-diaminopimelate ligase [Virgibacillus oceani]GGG69801.1 UDP-N-acetylmuramoyl-L-alanyl-D-glutamate--2,6-diaminopimelate ligase [Virgibacillus oceani]
MKLSEIISVLPFYDTATLADNDVEINDIEIDSKKVKPGDLFVCIRGFRVDGHDFAAEAIYNGAGAILTERNLNLFVPTIIVPDTSRALAMITAKFFDFPSAKLPLIGVTGTNGKTTTTYLLETIFNQLQVKTGIIGTIQLKVGNETYPVPNTTPNALFLQKTIRKMKEKNVSVAIMEVSSHALDMGRVYGCDFDIAIFTNLTQDHLDYHKNMDDYLHAKSLLFAQLGNTYDNGRKKFAVINMDDPHYEKLKRSTAQYVIPYGNNHDALVKAKNIRLDITGTSFTLDAPIGNVHVNSKLIGMFNVYNMLAASAAAIAAGVPISIIKSALEIIPGVSGRFEPVQVGQPFATIVDYAHTPDSLENVLQTIKDFAKRNIYVVVGCGGDRDRTKRPLMAAIALKYADYAIFTSDNPRTEDPQVILDDMTQDLTDTHYDVVADRKQAIFQAVYLAKEDDIVLIAGKGHETYQQIGNVKYKFDDREIAKEAILSKGK